MVKVSQEELIHCEALEWSRVRAATQVLRRPHAQVYTRGAGRRAGVMECYATFTHLSIPGMFY